jgi:predicted aminopeptidase
MLKRILLASLIPCLLSGCYVMQAAHGEMQVLEHRRPIADVIEDPKTAEPVRASLEEVRDARDFASRVLHLPDNRSYRTYSDIGRPYAVWNVVAAPEFSIEPKEWCFPVTGCVAYRGYFSKEEAEHFAAELHTQGYDVLVGGVPAFSTLGHFADPVLNTMMVYGDVELAAIIFHELAHQVVYVAGDSAFNEAFATSVEDEGVKRWLLAQGRVDELRRYDEESARQLDYIRLFLRRRAQLEQLYASGLPSAEMRVKKRELYAALEADMRKLEERHKAPSLYHEWLEHGLNNAELASVATYYDCVPGFKRILQEQDSDDLQRFYDSVRRLAELPQSERDMRVCGGAG